MKPHPRKRFGWIILVILLVLMGVRGWYVYAATGRLRPPSPLTLAVKQGDSEAVHLLLQRGGDPNSSEDGFGASRINPLPLLLYAVQRGDISTVRTLLDDGADPNIKDKTGRTPLMMTVIVHRADIAQLLLERGAEIDAKSKVGKTALFMAIEHGQFSPYPEYIKLLLAHHADVNTTSKTGKTLLMLAAQQNNGFLCYLLLSHGEKRDARDQEGHSALWHACEYDSKQAALDLLRYHAAWDAKDQNDLLLGAAWCGLDDFIEKLLDSGANINVQDARGNTPLMRALTHNHADVANRLLERGADGSLVNSIGGAPILAAGGSHPEIVSSLLAKGADPNLKREDGLTPLMLASSRGNLRIINILLSHGAKVNASDTNKNTAMNLAKTMQAQWNTQGREPSRKSLMLQGSQPPQWSRPPGERKYAETIERLKAAGATE